MSAFEQPRVPTGYIAFSAEDNTFRGRYRHFKDLVAFADEHGLVPGDLNIYRLYGRGLKEIREFMPLEDYTYVAKGYQKIGDMWTELEYLEWVDESVRGRPEVGSGTENAAKVRARAKLVFIGDNGQTTIIQPMKTVNHSSNFYTIKVAIYRWSHFISTLLRSL